MANEDTQTSSISARDALERLREGNRRFVGGKPLLQRSLHDTNAALGEGQTPCAIILGCSDSRVPAEIVFDQGLGDLFVIRVAGNVVAPSQIGSVEFAASRFGTRLVVVLGHSRCGAILATLEELQRPAENQSRNLRSSSIGSDRRWRLCSIPSYATIRIPWCVTRYARMSGCR